MNEIYADVKWVHYGEVGYERTYLFVVTAGTCTLRLESYFYSCVGVFIWNAKDCSKFELGLSPMMYCCNFLILNVYFSITKVLNDKCCSSLCGPFCNLPKFLNLIDDYRLKYIRITVTSIVLQ